MLLTTQRAKLSFSLVPLEALPRSPEGTEHVRRFGLTSLMSRIHNGELFCWRPSRLTTTMIFEDQTQRQNDSIWTSRKTRKYLPGCIVTSSLRFLPSPYSYRLARTLFHLMHIDRRVQITCLLGSPEIPKNFSWQHRHHLCGHGNLHLDGIDLTAVGSWSVQCPNPERPAKGPTEAPGSGIPSGIQEFAWNSVWDTGRFSLVGAINYRSEHTRRIWIGFPRGQGSPRVPKIRCDTELAGEPQAFFLAVMDTGSGPAGFINYH